MLKLKVLKGPMPGQTFQLKLGENTVGRAPDCDVILQATGVSKRHAKLMVQGDQCMVTDLNSSNGTFVNGIRIKDRILRVGDKIGFHNVILELARESGEMGRGLPVIPQGWNGNAAMGMQPGMQMEQQPMISGMPHESQMQAPGQPQAPQPTTLGEFITRYVDTVVMPGIYKVAEIYPLRNVLGAFVTLFAIIVTALATIPMAQLSQEGVHREAQRRAITIAKQLAGASERVLTATGEGVIRTDFAENEDGVNMAIVVAKDDGHIIAPITKAQSYTSDEFVARARKINDEYVSQISSSTIGVSEPIHSFSSEVGQSVTTAYAIVIYKMDSLDWSATIGLFARVLIIALAVGFILYFALYKLIAYPISSANTQIDEALRGARDNIETKINFDHFNRLVDNINSAISRMSQGAESKTVSVDRVAEAANIVRIIKDAAFVLDGQLRFSHANSGFEDVTGMRVLTIQGQGLEILQDQALKLNLEDLINQGRNQLGNIMTSQLDISGIGYEIDLVVSADHQAAGTVSFVFGTLKKRGEGA